MIPVHAIVMIFGFSPDLPQLTITAGTGLSIVPGFSVLFIMVLPVALHRKASFIVIFTFIIVPYLKLKNYKKSVFIWLLLYYTDVS